MVDEKTLEQFVLALRVARAEGKPLVEVLDRYGLLLTNERFNKIRATAVEHIAVVLEATQPADLLGDSYHKGTHTAADMYRKTVEFVRSLVR